MAANPMTLRDAMIEASRRRALAKWPDNYYWVAIWWRLQARESRNPISDLEYSKNQFLLWKDCIARPNHYKNKLIDITDYLWSKK